MKKLFCVFLCVLTAVLMCSCKKEEEPENQPALKQQAEVLVEKKEEEIKPEPQKEPEKPKEPEKEEKPEEPEEPETPKMPQFTYTVADADNVRGLSTEKKGFSFGVAKDGVPHNQSVINQQTFDSYENVDALALDTKSQEKVMYLTFDNGYEYKNLTADILDTLKEKNVKAAFFITLDYAKKNKTLVRRMIDEGHIVGNHSASHPSFPKLTRTQMAEEIATLDNYLRNNYLYTSPYFRFPSGEYSECALELVTSIGYRSIFWSVAYADWDTSIQKGEDYAFSTVTSRFHPGAVILLHAVSQDNTDALGRIIDEAHAQGYKFKTLEEYSY